MECAGRQREDNPQLAGEAREAGKSWADDIPPTDRNMEGMEGMEGIVEVLPDATRNYRARLMGEHLCRVACSLVPHRTQRHDQEHRREMLRKGEGGGRSSHYELVL